MTKVDARQLQPISSSEDETTPLISYRVHERASTSLADLARVDIAPMSWEPAATTRRASRRIGRREFLRVLASAAVGTGLAFAGLFPTTRSVRATDRTPACPYSSSCYGGPGDYAGSTGCCSCGSAVSSTYCGSDSWHRDHSVVACCSTTYYRLRLDSCGGENAWLWNREGTTWRCSDGQKKLCIDGDGCGSWTDTVCPKSNPGSC